MNPTQEYPSPILVDSESENLPAGKVTWQPVFSGTIRSSSPEPERETATRGFPKAVIGAVVELTPQQIPMVDFTGNPLGKPVAARSCVPLSALRHGMKLLLFFENADPAKPVIVGILHESGPVSQPVDVPSQPPQIEVDGERLVYTAQKEIVLRCGKASIQLQADGSVLIRGAHVLSRASGTNRIRGGNVQIN